MALLARRGSLFFDCNVVDSRVVVVYEYQPFRLRRKVFVYLESEPCCLKFQVLGAASTKDPNTLHSNQPSRSDPLRSFNHRQSFEILPCSFKFIYDSLTDLDHKIKSLWYLNPSFILNDLVCLLCTYPSCESGC
jgi:hypothetical protein